MLNIECSEKKDKKVNKKSIKLIKKQIKNIGSLMAISGPPAAIYSIYASVTCPCSEDQSQQEIYSLLQKECMNAIYRNSVYFSFLFLSVDFFNKLFLLSRVGKKINEKKIIKKLKMFLKYSYQFAEDNYFFLLLSLFIHTKYKQVKYDNKIVCDSDILFLSADFTPSLLMTILANTDIRHHSILKIYQGIHTYEDRKKLMEIQDWRNKWIKLFDMSFEYFKGFAYGRAYISSLLKVSIFALNTIFKNNYNISDEVRFWLRMSSGLAWGLLQAVHSYHFNPSAEDNSVKKNFLSQFNRILSTLVFFISYTLSFQDIEKPHNAIQLAIVAFFIVANFLKYCCCPEDEAYEMNQEYTETQSIDLLSERSSSSGENFKNEEKGLVQSLMNQEDKMNQDEKKPIFSTNPNYNSITSPEILDKNDSQNFGCQPIIYRTKDKNSLEQKNSEEAKASFSSNNYSHKMKKVSLKNHPNSFHCHTKNIALFKTDNITIKNKLNVKLISTSHN